MTPKLERPCIYIFNLTSDLNSPVLAASIEWVKAFSRQSNCVQVFSTHLGEVPSLKNVKFYEIGGGSPLRRLLGLIRLIKIQKSIIQNRRNALVFHHMSPRTAVILGPMLRLAHVPQGLWYSHSVASPAIKIAKYFVDYLFTSSESSMPIKSGKIKYVGHGISTELFEMNRTTPINRMSICSVGRITPIKRLEKVIEAASSLEDSIKEEIDIDFVGIAQNEFYKTTLENLAMECKLQISFLPAIEYEKLSGYYNSQSIYFSGTPMSVDKATLEAAFCGCFIVSENIDALKLTGMDLLYGDKSKTRIPSIADQLRVIYSLEGKAINDARNLISHSAKSMNDVDKTVSKILQSLRSNEK